MENRTINSQPGFAADIGMWMWCLVDARRRTLENLQNINQVELDWFADPGANSIGSLLYHIAAIEMSYVYEDLLTGNVFPEILESLLPFDVRQADGSLTVVTGESLAAHLDRLARCRQLLLEVFRALQPDEFHQPLHLDAYEISPAWVVHHLMQHEAEHRGQIEEIRRLFARISA